MKFCRFVADIYPHMRTNFGSFILIFNKMALIFLGVLIVFTVLSFELQQVRLSWLIANDEWPQFIQFNSLDCHIWGNAGVLTKPATEAKTSSRVLKCTLVNLVCLTGESHWQHCERLPPPTSGMCVSQRWTFWTFNVIIHLTDTNTCLKSVVAVFHSVVSGFLQ